MMGCERKSVIGGRGLGIILRAVAEALAAGTDAAKPTQLRKRLQPSWYY